MMMRRPTTLVVIVVLVAALYFSIVALNNGMAAGAPPTINDNQQDKRIRAVICDFYASSSSSTIDSSEIARVHDNHRAYAASHNYSYVHQSQPLYNASVARWPAWNKVLLLMKLLDERESSGDVRHDWVLWVDSDALFCQKSRSLQKLLSHYNAWNASFLFSGDTNAINSGVLLLRNTAWSRMMLAEVWAMGEALETRLSPHRPLGMAGDNALFSAFLGGCTSLLSSTVEDYRACYAHTDLGWSPPRGQRRRDVAKRIAQADDVIYKTMIHPSVLPHVRALPRGVFNAEALGPSAFVVHFAGWKSDRSKSQRLQEALQSCG